MRRRLTERQERASAAGLAITQLEDQQRALAARLTEAKSRLETEVLASIEQESDELRRIVYEQAAALSHTLSGVAGLRDFLSAQGRRSSNGVGSGGFYRLNERIADIQPRGATPSDAAIEDAARWWASHFEELKNGI